MQAVEMDRMISFLGTLWNAWLKNLAGDRGGRGLLNLCEMSSLLTFLRCTEYHPKSAMLNDFNVT